MIRYDLDWRGEGAGARFSRYGVPFQITPQYRTAFEIEIAKNLVKTIDASRELVYVLAALR